MIINIRGTGGSGKSTVVTRVMERYSGRQAVYVDGRKQPLMYYLHRVGVANGTPAGNSLMVPGHYEIPTGGCDTLKTPDIVYQLVTEAALGGYDVLYEGIMVGDDVTRCVELSRKFKVLVIALDTPIAECIAGIQARRDARGDERPLSEKNTVNRLERLRKSMMPRLKDAGVECKWLKREEAYQRVVKEFGLE